MLPELHHQSVIGFGCFLFLRQKTFHQHCRGVCTSLFPTGCLGRTRVSLSAHYSLPYHICLILLQIHFARYDYPILFHFNHIQLCPASRYIREGLKGWREACGTNEVQKTAKERLQMMPNEQKG